MDVKNKIFIPQAPASAKPLLLDKEVDDIRSLLSRIEKEVSGKPISEVCRKLIKSTMDRAGSNLQAVMTYKKISDQDKRR